MINRINIDLTMLKKKVELYSKYITGNIGTYAWQSLYILQREIERILNNLSGNIFIDSKISTYTADGITVPELYIEFINDIYNDLSIVLNSHVSFNKTVNSYLQYSSSIAMNTNNLIDTLNNAVINKTISNNTVNYKTVEIVDSFNDNTKIDFNKSSIYIENGVCSLKPISRQNYNSIITPYVIDKFTSDNIKNSLYSFSDGSIIGNGFSGNNLECYIRRVVFDSDDYYTSNSTIKYSIDNNNVVYVDPNRICSVLQNILDNNSKTTFEYELVNIAEQYKDICNNYGLSYTHIDNNGNKNNIYWFNPTDKDMVTNLINNTHSYGIQQTNGELVCPILLKLKTKQKINKITIDINYNNGIYSTLKNVYIHSTTSDSWIKCNYDQNINTGDMVIYIDNPSDYYDMVVIIFNQTQSYNTYILHDYYHSDISNNNLQDSMSISSSDTSIQYQHLNERVDGPNRIISNNGIVTDNLSNIPSTMRGPLKEIFPAWRYSININNIKVENNEYKNQSILYSNKYLMDINISELYINVDDYIYNDTNIDYYISINNGLTWAPISKYTDSKPSYPKKYIVIIDPNIENINNVIDSSAGKIYTKVYPNTVKFKAVLNGGSQTPYIKSYSIICRGNSL